MDPSDERGWLTVIRLMDPEALTPVYREGPRSLTPTPHLLQVLQYG